MINTQLRLAIIKILYRLDGVPLREETLKAELEIAVATPLTTTEYQQTMATLVEQGLCFKTHDDLLNEDTYSLSFTGREAAKKYAKSHF
jgi:hypothetical protein